MHKIPDPQAVCNSLNPPYDLDHETFCDGRFNSLKENRTIWNRTRPRAPVENRQTREFISTWKTSHKQQKHGMQVTASYINSISGTSGGVYGPCIYWQSRWELPLSFWLWGIFWVLINCLVCWLSKHKLDKLSFKDWNRWPWPCQQQLTPSFKVTLSVMRHQSIKFGTKRFNSSENIG